MLSIMISNNHHGSSSYGGLCIYLKYTNLLVGFKKTASCIRVLLTSSAHG